MQINHFDNIVRVRCELGFPDKDGKVESVSHEDVRRELQSISDRYGSNNVMIEFSAEAGRAFFGNLVKEKIDFTSEQYKKELEKRSARIEPYLKPARKRHYLIPNIKTNDKLEKSLKGADEQTSDAAYYVIYHNFLPHNIGDLTEEERQELISVGLEEAKYLSERLDADKSGLFMEAMTTIAKYGMNGKTDADGKVTYDIRQGSMVGAPDDYMSSWEMMQKIAPDQYQLYDSMMNEALKKKDNALLLKAFKAAIEWEMNAYKTNPKPFEDVKKEQLDWVNSMNNTQLKYDYANADRTDLQTFMDSMMLQRNKLDYTYLFDNLNAFANFFRE